MGRTRKKTDISSSKRVRPVPASTPEARENQLIALAVDLAEQQLMDGTASAQVITHYLKLGTAKEKLEREIMEEQRKMLQAKTESIRSSQRVEELYADAMKAMQIYSGKKVEDDE